MAGSVKFILDAEPAKAVAGFLRILESQKKVQSEFKGIKDKGEEANTTFAKLNETAGDFTKTLVGMAGGFVSFEGLKSTIEAIVEGIKKANEETIRLRESSAGGASMPAYIKDQPGYQKRSVELSNLYDADVNNVVNPLRENVYVHDSNLPARQQDEIVERSLKARELAGADPSAFAATTGSLVQGYKLSPKQASNVEMFLRDVGGLKLGDEQNEVISSLLPAMKTMGVGLDQFEALTGMINKAGGSNTQIGRGIKETLLKMPDLQEKGIVSKGGDFFKHFQELGALEKKDPKAFIDAIGKRGAPAIDFIAKNPQMYQSLLTQARQYQSGDALDALEQKTMADPTIAGTIKAARAKREGVNIGKATTPAAMSWQTTYQVGTNVAQSGLPVGVRDVPGVPLVAGANMLAAGSAVSTMKGVFSSGLARNFANGLSSIFGGAVGSGASGGGQHLEQLGKAAERLDKAGEHLERGAKEHRIYRNLKNNSEN